MHSPRSSPSEDCLSASSRLDRRWFDHRFVGSGASGWRWSLFDRHPDAPSLCGVRTACGGRTASEMQLTRMGSWMLVERNRTVVADRPVTPTPRLGEEVEFGR